MHLLYVLMSPYILMHPLHVWMSTCLDIWTPLYVWIMFGCPMHTQHKESMLCHTKGVSYAPIHLDAHCMFGCPHVWTPPYVMMPNMFEHTAVCFSDVWMPLYIHNTKKACYVTLKGCPYAPYIWMSTYVWMHPVCLNAPICLDTPCMFWMPPYLHTTHMF